MTATAVHSPPKVLPSLAVVAVVMVGLLGYMSSAGVFGAWTTTQANTVSGVGGTVSLTDTAQSTMTITNFSSGDTADRVVRIQNAGNLAWSNVALTAAVNITVDTKAPTATNAQILSSTAGVNVQVYYCSAGWTWTNGTTFGCTTWTPVGTMAIGNNTAGTATNWAAGLPVAAAESGLKFTFGVCSGSNTPVTGCVSEAPQDLEGASATYTFNFAAAQRAATNL
jgi:hypothetical protein